MKQLTAKMAVFEPPQNVAAAHSGSLGSWTAVSVDFRSDTSHVCQLSIHREEGAVGEADRSARRVHQSQGHLKSIFAQATAGLRAFQT